MRRRSVPVEDHVESVRTGRGEETSFPRRGSREAFRSYPTRQNTGAAARSYRADSHLLKGLRIPAHSSLSTHQPPKPARESFVMVTEAREDGRGVLKANQCTKLAMARVCMQKVRKEIV